MLTDRKPSRAAVMAALVLALMSHGAIALAHAQEKNDNGPRFEGELSVEFETDRTFKSDDPDSKITDSYPTIGLGASWIFNQYFSINGSFTAEPVIDPVGDRFFEDVGLYTEELYAQLQFGPARLFAGKFNPSFGQAWDLIPGLYSTGFVEDYQLTERLGLGLAFSAEGTALGDVDLTANSFTVDTSGLADRFFTRTARPSLADGGVGNTGKLDNFSVTLDGRNLPLLPNIAWHLGYSHQRKEAKGTDNPFDETGLVTGLYGAHKIFENLSFDWVGEIALLQNAGGGANDQTYYTFGSVLTFSDRYNLAVAHTSRAIDVAGGADFTDTTSQISVGMEVHDGWTVDVGYTFAKEANIKSQTVGVLLAKTFEFSSGE